VATPPTPTASHERGDADANPHDVQCRRRPGTVVRGVHRERDRSEQVERLESGALGWQAASRGQTVRQEETGRAGPAKNVDERVQLRTTSTRRAGRPRPRR